MSRLSSWAYVANCTAWKREAFDDWEQSEEYGAPINVKAVYSVNSKTVKNSLGDEITASLKILTEFGELSEGDRIAIGENAPFDESREILAVSVDFDVFYLEADDYTYYT